MKAFVFILLVGLYFIPSVVFKRVVIDIFSIIWFIITFIYFLYIYYKKDKEYESSFKEEYCLTAPSCSPPEVIGFLLTCSVKKEYLTASIIELIRKKAISINKGSKDYYLIDNKNSKQYLTRTELYIKKWLFKCIGDGDKVSFGLIKKESKNNSGYFYSCYHEWVDLVHFDCARYNFFESKKEVIEQTLLYFATSYVLALYNILITHNYLISILILIITTLFIIYVNNFYRRNKETNREYEEWMAFKRYIQKEDNHLNEYDNNTLGIYSVYAKVLNVNLEFRNILKKKAKENKNIYEDDPILPYICSDVIDNLDKILVKGIKRSVVANILFVRNGGRTTVKR